MNEPLSPKEAFWDPQAREAFLMYEVVRNADSPEKAVLDFLESVYQAGAKKANWDIEAFRLPSSGKEIEEKSENPEAQPKKLKKPEEHVDILEKLERPEE
jgi:hypothetical protein